MFYHAIYIAKHVKCKGHTPMTTPHMEEPARAMWQVHKVTSQLCLHQNNVKMYDFVAWPHIWQCVVYPYCHMWFLVCQTLYTHCADPGEMCGTLPDHPHNLSLSLAEPCFAPLGSPNTRKFSAARRSYHDS